MRNHLREAIREVDQTGQEQARRCQQTYTVVDERDAEDICEEENSLVFGIVALRGGDIALYATNFLDNA